MFKKKFMEILQKLGFMDKAKQNSLTEDEWAQIDAAFKKEFGKSMSELMNESSTNKELEKERSIALQLINETEKSDSEPQKKGEKESETSIVEGIKNIQSELKEARRENQAIKEQMEKMSRQAQPDHPLQVVSRKITPAGPGHTETHLFGIEHPMFSLKDRWNQITLNPSIAKISQPSGSYAEAFTQATHKYGASLAERYHYLQKSGQLDRVRKSASFTNDFTELDKSGLGDQYVTLRRDALIARILQIPTVYEFFPRRYGVQDRELMTIAYFDELSQAYQAGHVFKGGMKLQPEMGYVDDSMFKVEFGPMKEIERMYIGYLNTDGSDPMKWSMIEWQLLNMYTKLVNEQNTRVIRGCYVKPEKGIPGSYLNAGTGLLYTLQRYYHEHKLLPHSDAIYNDYTKTTMLDAVKAFVSDVRDTLDDEVTLDNKFLYLNKRHFPWWVECVRKAYGQQTDFTGPNGYANIVPDTEVRIKWLPNLGNNKLMFIQEHGNLQALEFVPGEMLAVDFDRAMELMHVWSTWKEGFSGYIVGKAFDSREKLVENNYSMQEIFMNHPATLLEADATKIEADKNYWFKTGENSAATAITEITNAKKGVVYVIETGTKTNASTIAKAGNFDQISEAWNPTQEGDYIMVILNSESKFMELERCVGGKRTINTELQPNIIGGRK